MRFADINQEEINVKYDQHLSIHMMAYTFVLLMQYFFRKSFMSFIFDLFAFPFLMFCISHQYFIYRLTFLFLMFIQIADLSSLLLTFETITNMTIHAIGSIEYFDYNIPGQVLLVCFMLFMLFLTFFRTKKQFVLPFKLTQYFPLILSFLLYKALAIHYKLFFPILANVDIAPKNYTSEDIYRFFETPMNLRFRPGTNQSQLKNIIVLVIESLETQTIGPFYKGVYAESCRDHMPFLYNLSQNSLFALNGIEYTYISYSMAALFTYECNIPLIGGSINVGLQTTKYPRCVSNMLKSIGYHTEAHYPTIGKVNHQRDYLTRREYDIFDSKNIYPHPLDRDGAMWDNLIKTVLPQMRPDTRKQPWYLTVKTTNTHLNENRDEPDYVQRINKICPSLLGKFDFEDQCLERFFKAFYDNKLNENTEIILFGDHHHFSYDLFNEDDRGIVIMLPTQPKHLLKRPSNIYDIAPTILDLIGVEMNPPFLYGNSLLNDTEAVYPSSFDHSMLCNIYEQTSQLNSKFTKDKTAYELVHLNSTYDFKWTNSNKIIIEIAYMNKREK